MALREENIRLIFGLKMRQLRIDAGLSLSDLADRTGISVSYLNEIERARKYPRGDKIAVLAEALRTNYDQMVSLKLDKRLEPVGELLREEFVHDLPLDMFGMEMADLLGMMAGAPSKLSAFVSTLIEISRNYGLGFEEFYFAVLRTYQQMHDNYFPELEREAIRFLAEYKLTAPVAEADLERVLKKQFNYEVRYTTFMEEPALKGLRSLTVPGRRPRLLLNEALGIDQRRFALCRELGYAHLKPGHRSYTSSWVRVDSFDQVLNNFKASYFASALLLPGEVMQSEFQQFVQLKSFDSAFLPGLMQRFGVSSETLLHRMTSLLPHYFGLNELFFLRMEQKNHDQPLYNLTKVLHLNGEHSPNARARHEHYCRRWLSLSVMNERKASGSDILCRAQQSHYHDSDNQYLLLSIANAPSAWQPRESSVAIGLRMGPQLKKVVRFWNDTAIPVRVVGQTCERCGLGDCSERAAPPEQLEWHRQIEAMKQALSRWPVAEESSMAGSRHHSATRNTLSGMKTRNEQKKQSKKDPNHE
jgi:predicted transcriptional regulator/DNA-binding XRE family transcriptional regulator